MVTFVTSGSRLTYIQQLSRGAIIWKQLKHQNLLPLSGVSTSIELPGANHQHLCLVSPWMENGNTHVFIRNNPTFN